MESLDGFEKIEKTRILPLRWIGNACNRFADPHLICALHYDDHSDYGFAYKYHAIIWNIFSKPYMWWGTFYKWEFDETE